MRLPALCLLLAGGPALAAPGRVIPCDPPLNIPLRLSIIQHLWLADGNAATVTVTRRLRFLRDGEGVAVEAEIAALSVDEPGQSGARDRMLLAYGAPGAVRIRVRLDAAMAIRGVESLDTLWQDFRGRQARLDAEMMRGGKGHDRTDAMLRALDAMDEAGRVAILTGFLMPVLRHCGTMAPPEASISPDGAISIESRADSGGVSDTGRYAVDGRTGLLRTLERSMTTAGAPLRPLREQWVLGPD